MFLYVLLNLLVVLVFPTSVMLLYRIDRPMWPDSLGRETMATLP